MGGPFLFVVGCERSGTTLLRAMLDSHPDMAVPPESNFIPNVIRASQQGRHFSPPAFVATLLSNRWFLRWGLTESDLRGALRTDCPPTASAAVETIYRLYAQQRGKNRWGDKTPRYVEVMSDLARWFPESRFVHIIRDGRSTALAFYEAPWNSAESMELAALHWRRRARAGRRAGRALGPVRYREVRYESLVSDPEGELEGVCRFAGLAYDNAMLGYPERADLIVSSSPIAAALSGIHQPPTPGLRDWRAIPIAARRRMEFLIGRTLDDLGYEVEGRPPASSLERVELHALKTRYSGRRLLDRSVAAAGKWHANSPRARQVTAPLKRLLASRSSDNSTQLAR